MSAAKAIAMMGKKKNIQKMENRKPLVTLNDIPPWDTKTLSPGLGERALGRIVRHARVIQ